MTRVAPGIVVAENLSQAWLETTKEVRSSHGGKGFHTMTRINQPLVEDPDIRARCDALLKDRHLQSVATVARTIFPSSLAAATSSPAELVEHYRANYATYRRFPGNKKGIYFGRIVEYPGPGEPRDQLVPLITRLHSERESRTPMSARYEVTIAAPGDDKTPIEVESENAEAPTAGHLDGGAALTSASTDTAAVEVSVPIHLPSKDTSRRGFPCLSLLSFQLDSDRVHLLATYRYEYLISKGYGNYVGLARLLEYVATSAGLQVGALSIAAGRIEADAPGRAIGSHLGALWDGA